MKSRARHGAPVRRLPRRGGQHRRARPAPRLHARSTSAIASPTTRCRPGETPIAHLAALAERGARARYGTGPLAERARKQIAHELDLIGRLDLAGYFLIVWDLVEYCRAHDILVQGRGSAANSAVCYALGITAVDPVGMELLFERFLSEERGEWPDIDLDLPSGDRREQVIQYVYRATGASARR